MAGEVVTLAAEALPYAAAALGAYGTAVLTTVKEELADATVAAGRKLLQRIFGRQEGESLPAVVAEVIEHPGDEDYLSALRLAIRKAMEADPRLADDVRGLIAAAGPSVSVHQQVLVGRDAYVSGRDMTVNRPAR